MVDQRFFLNLFMEKRYFCMVSIKTMHIALHIRVESKEESSLTIRENKC